MAKAKKKTPRAVKILLGVTAVGILITAFVVYAYRDCFKFGIKLCISAKQYQSSRVPLSLKYPSYFPLSEPSGRVWDQMDSRYEEYFDFAPEFFRNAGGDRLGSMRVSTASGITNINDLAKDLSTPKEITLANGAGSWKVIEKPPKVEKVTIGNNNNIEALKISEVDVSNMLSDAGIEYVFFRNGLKYSITFYYNDYHHKRPRSDYENGFKFILNTLRVD